MDATNLKKLLDACFTAKHVIETMAGAPQRDEAPPYPCA